MMDREPHWQGGAASGDWKQDRPGPLPMRVLGGAFAAAVALVFGLVVLLDRLLG